ncbi:hypothetical protein DH2020_001960 [Rehmannia glutinosa]|uniref:CHD3-type chromatin-remodeling factor PICKLE-like protein n=1 Tax=Rehmannia glutinosa TaxID=99300 RepID=A0ABR0XT32_REHGL
MASLVERLRVRSDRRPIYNIDESDEESDFVKKKPGMGPSSDKIEKIERPDTSLPVSSEDIGCEAVVTSSYSYQKEGSCQACGKDDNLLSCETCTYAYHPKCLLPVLRGPHPSNWKCPECVGHLNELEKILDCEMRPSAVNDSDAPKLGSNQAFMKHYLVKWKGLSYLHCAWVPETEFVKAYKEVEEGKEYFVKWNELSYDECSWELESSISSFHKEIEKFNRICSQHDRISAAKQKRHLRDAMELKKKQKEFQQQNNTEYCLFSISFEENIYPHLVVAPLSTLRNWEREFATWAPHMNVVMYAGTAQARGVIREYEFYYPKSQKKSKKKKSGQAVSESKQDRIKFDVLLTSYEMINMDSSSLKSIKWECLIVDEGHRLKNKDSKLFSSLTQYSSSHRVLLTGTPLQNNLDELFMLMHFLDAGKFGSLEDFQEEFKDINQEEQISRLHTMLAPHLLRRVKKDVMKELPPKKELILRVELSSKQKEYYKAILTRNYQILTRKGGAQVEISNSSFAHNDIYLRQLLETSGKLQLLDKMMVKLKEQGHRVLIYSQFQHMLDLLEDYCNYRKWHYERIDGKVGGAERQIRIDRFNAKNSSRFCFLLSTRAGGIGINLATADTVIIYDSDWNPHADLQAMARAHRLGQTNKVVLIVDHAMEDSSCSLLVLSMNNSSPYADFSYASLPANLPLFICNSCYCLGNLPLREELDDIIRYGSKELFADDSDELVKSRQIHYDDTAIDRLLDREQVGEEDASLEDEEEDGFLKAFKVANFEYVDEAELAEEETPVPPVENKASVNNSERASYWEDLLRDKYEVNKIEEFNAMGKGKRSRKQCLRVEGPTCTCGGTVYALFLSFLSLFLLSCLSFPGNSASMMVSVEEDDLAGLEDVSSDGEDDNYEAESTDNETASTGAAAIRRPYRKRARGTSEKIPLMEGEGRYLRVLGFNQSQRAVFVQILMRFGIPKSGWAEFTQRLKQKTLEEIKEYVISYCGLFYSNSYFRNIVESMSVLELLSCNPSGCILNSTVTLHSPALPIVISTIVCAPKEGLRIEDVLVRIGTLSLIRDKVKALSEGSTILFTDDIISRYPGLKGGRLWKEQHDRLLLRAVMKHGYGRWQAIVDDKDLRIQEVICQELNLPFINTPGPGAPQAQNLASGTSQAQASASGVSEPHVPTPGLHESQNGVNLDGVEAPGNQAKGTTGGNESGAGATNTTARTQLFQDQSTLYHFREMQRRQVEFIKKRVLLLEKGLNAELQKVYYADDKMNDIVTDETGRKVTDVKYPSSEASDAQMAAQLPQVEIISPEEISASACDKNSHRFDMARLYNEISGIVADNGPDLGEAYSRAAASLKLKKDLGALEAFSEEINKILSPVQDEKAKVENLSSSSTLPADNNVLGVGTMDTDNPIQSSETEANHQREASNLPLSNGTVDVEMEEMQEDNSEVIIMD